MTDDRAMPPGMPDDMPDDPTKEAEVRIVFEIAERAHICARECALDPENHQKRKDCVVACARLNVDYLCVLGQYMDGTACSFVVARRQVAAWLQREADQWFDQMQIQEHNAAEAQVRLDAERAERLARQSLSDGTH